MVYQIIVGNTDQNIWLLSTAKQFNSIIDKKEKSVKLQIWLEVVHPLLGRFLK